MHSKAWFDAYEAAHADLEDAGCPPSLVGEAAADMANASVVSRLLDRADDLRDREKEGR